MDASPALVTIAVLLVGLAGTLGYLAGLRHGLSGGPDPTAADAAHGRDPEAEVLVVREGLERLHDQLRDLEHQRVSWQGQLHQQVLDMRAGTEALRRETQSLSTALRRPQVRGRWGELHLRRAVELAGLVAHCDFSEQSTHVGADDGVRRPDLVVSLAGERHVVVDAKVPLDAFLDATATDEAEDRDHHLARHARQVRSHIDGLGAKAYWRSLASTPEFVVLFLPSETFLVAALEADAGLVEYAAERNVVLATPSTLIALLRTVAHGWRQERLSHQTAEVHRLGRELHRRLQTLSAHFDQLGRSLNGAVTHYNAAVGSWESRVLVQARRFSELGVTDDPLAAPGSVASQAVAPAVRRGDTIDPSGPSTVAV
ncbi:DNA recombination protein RmuC [Nocardioides sp. R-C-SC26]|uniref:DNA recombination protein RmuC n=1 Tax=Nocardioides sp. R-C-SC26 TaxID=2870414 RepID=UPI001E422A46|nr:DNA recombination protein RmuC [Nocardioides sp. R-C-SC26]